MLLTTQDVRETLLHHDERPQLQLVHYFAVTVFFPAQEMLCHAKIME